MGLHKIKAYAAGELFKTNRQGISLCPFLQNKY